MSEFVEEFARSQDSSVIEIDQDEEVKEVARVNSPAKERDSKKSKKARKRKRGNPSRSPSPGSDSSEPDDLQTTKVVQGPKGFRLQAKRMFLTYAQCDNSPLFTYNALKDRVMAKGIKHFTIAQESHRDGSKHLHIFLHLDSTLDTRNQRFFEMPGEQPLPIRKFNPNIRVCKHRFTSDLLRIYEYLSKESLPVDFADAINPWRNSKNFRQTYYDHEAWRNYMQARAAPVPTWPKLFPDGSEIKQPSFQHGQRHIWLWGPTFIGKSEWFRQQFAHQLFFPVARSDTPFDDYKQQQVILYDDHYPDLFTLTTLANRHDQAYPVPGRTRYGTRYLPAKVPLLIIVLLNRSIDEVWPDDAKHNREVERSVFHARFTEIHVTRREDFTTYVNDNAD